MSSLIKKFLRRPDIVEAFKWDGKTETLRIPEISLFMANNPHFTGELGSIFIHTLEGEVREAKPGDYIVKGLRGEIYPVSKESFLEGFEEVVSGEEPAKEEPKTPIIMSIPKEAKKEEKPKIDKKKPVASVNKYSTDVEGLENGLGIKLEDMDGLEIEIPLQELNRYCPRDFVKAKSYMGLVGHLKRTYGVDLIITSQRSGK